MKIKNDKQKVQPEVTLEQVKEWISERIRYYTEQRKAIFDTSAMDLPEKMLKAEKVDGSLRAFELVDLMLSGLYSCEYCSNNDSACANERNVCALFDFSVTGAKEG